MGGVCQSLIEKESPNHEIVISSIILPINWFSLGKEVS